MFIAIYKFEIHQDKEKEFIQSWEDLTKLIYEYEGSLGSRLHKESETVFIAYAQWPDEETFNNSGDKLPEKANEARIVMREACHNIETLHRLEMMTDLLKDKPSK